MTELLALGASALELSPPNHRRLETAERLELAVTGPESNAAVAARRLGTETAWTSKLPETPLGRRVVGDLRRHGVRTPVCWTESGRQELAFTERAGEPRGETTLHDRDGVVDSMEPADIPTTAVDDVSTVFASAATATRSATLTETTTTVFEELGARGTTTALSLSRPRATGADAPESLDPVLSATDVFFTTEAGAAAFGDRATPTETAHGLAAAHGFETVVLVGEDDGALVWHDSTVYEHEPPATETTDERGAFDALCGGFFARRLAGESPDDALAAGVACSALARTIVGPVPTIDPETVERCVAGMAPSGIE